MFELQKKQRELNKTYKLYDNIIKKAKKAKKPEDQVESLISEMFMETGMIEEEVKSLISRKWIQKAEKLFLPMPSYAENDCWETGNYTERRFLTPIGINKIRSLVRDEISAQRKAILEWVIPVIGLIGAVTGLVAVIFN